MSEETIREVRGVRSVMMDGSQVLVEELSERVRVVLQERGTFRTVDLDPLSAHRLGRHLHTIASRVQKRHPYPACREESK